MWFRAVFDVAVFAILIHTSTALRGNMSKLCTVKDTRDAGVHLNMHQGGKCHRVCSDGFTIMEATVACRELGRGTQHVRVHRVKGESEKGFVPSHGSRCTGGEMRLADCYWGTLQTCKEGNLILKCNSTDASYDMTVTLDKTDIRAYNGSKVTVTCSVSGMHHPWHWYQWTLGSKVIATAPSVTLHLSADDSGKKLACHVRERNMTHSSVSTIIQVFYPPDPFKNYALNVVQGSDVKLTSPGTSNPPGTCKWGRLELGAKLPAMNSTSSTIKNVSKKDEGMYVIEISNFMDVTEGIPRRGHGTRIVRLKVLDLSCVKEKYVMENGTVELSCVNETMWSSVSYNVTWSGPESSQDKTFTVTGTDGKNGTYNCTVEYIRIQNDAVTSTNSCRTTLHILDQPSSTMKVFSGSNVTADILNITEDTWQKLEEDQLKNIKLPKINVTKEDTGLYVYPSPEGREGRNVLKLQVLYGPKVTCKKRVAIAVGESKDLTCSIDAYPLVTDVTWSGSRCQKSVRETSGITSCRIGNVRMTDNDAIYTCIVNNTLVDSQNETRVERDSCNITLYIYERPTTSRLEIGIVSGVFSFLLLAMMVVVVILSRLLYRERRGKNRKHSVISLPMNTTKPPLPEVNVSAKKRPLPQAPGKQNENDIQQDVYENA